MTFQTNEYIKAIKMFIYYNNKINKNKILREQQQQQQQIN